MWTNEKTNRPPGASRRVLARTNWGTKQQFTAEKRARLPAREMMDSFDTLESRSPKNVV